MISTHSTSIKYSAVFAKMELPKRKEIPNLRSRVRNRPGITVKSLNKNADAAVQYTILT